MLKDIASSIKAQISSQVLNQETMTEKALAAFFAGGHIYLTGTTGLGKTAWGQSLAQALGASFNRVRFTEGVQSFEITGVHDRKGGQMEMQRGPLFSQVFMADGLGNAKPKVQSILMDAIDDQTVAVEGEKYYLPEPFFVIGTHEGTHPLSEALADRFMLTLAIDYPGVAAEKQILQMYNQAQMTDAHEPICSAETLAQAKQEAQAVAVEDAILNYIVSLTETTRRVGAVQTGASLRGSIALLKVAKSYAAIQGRDFVIMDDVRSLALPVLRHRIILRPDAILEGIQPDRIIESVLAGRRL